MHAMTSFSYWLIKASILFQLLFFNVSAGCVNIWSSVGDSFALESSDKSCVSRRIYTISGVEGEFLRIKPNKWHSGTIQFGCLKKINGICTRTCKIEGERPNLGEHSFLTFQARATGALLTAGGACTPRISMKGGSYPRKSSNTLNIEGVMWKRADSIQTNGERL